jgi:hypothetical protein
VQIKHWPKFQHFHNRRPPWIKLYRDLLDDEEWYRLPPASAKLLISLWLLASEDETKQGLCPPLPKIAFRLRISESSIISMCSKLSHWIILDDITMISPRHHLVPSETETETETEGEGEARDIMISRRRQKRVLRQIQDTDRPTEKHFQLGQSLHVDVGPEWGKFKNYCIAHDKRYANFDAAFRNWLVQAPQMNLKGGRA